MLKSSIIRTNEVLTQIGLDPIRFVRGVASLPWYLRALRQYRRIVGNNTKIVLSPHLHDRRDQAGGLGEYFWQDVTVSRMINEAKPTRHIDIGSRVDGFVAQVAAFRRIDVIDIRPLNEKIHNVTFRQADITAELAAEFFGCSDSVSCLHSIEHFGLGRYGDPILPNGREIGLRNLATMLKPGGRLYLSMPCGRERVEFNACWISDPAAILRMAELNGLSLWQLWLIGASGAARSAGGSNDIHELSRQGYQLTLFVFEKA